MSASPATALTTTPELASALLDLSGSSNEDAVSRRTISRDRESSGGLAMCPNTGVMQRGGLCPGERHEDIKEGIRAMPFPVARKIQLNTTGLG